MLDFAFTNQFKKDLKLMEKRRKNMDKIYEIMVLLIWEEPLPEHCREHKLHGDLEGLWDCHVEGDWVILYELDEGKKISFVFTGIHSDLL
jgi:mRNA interferase YafQ